MGVGTVSEGLLTSLESLLLLLFLINEISLLLLDPLCITDGVFLYFVIKLGLIVLFLDVLFVLYEFSDIFLYLGDVFLELVELLLDVLPVLLGLVELLADLVDLLVLGVDQWAQLVQLLIDGVALVVELVDLRLKFNDALGVGDTVLKLLDVGQNLLLLVGLQGRGLVPALHFLDHCLDLLWVLEVLTLRKSLSEAVTLMLKGVDAIHDLVSLGLKLLFLGLEVSSLLPLLLKEISECKR